LDGEIHKELNLFVSKSVNNYLEMSVNQNEYENSSSFTVCVADLNPQRANGIYQIEAGQAIWGDALGELENLLRVETKDHHLGDNRISVYSVNVENLTSNPIEDVELYYFFTSDNGGTPTFLDYYTPNSQLRLEEYDANRNIWALIYDFGTVPANSKLPSYLENQVHMWQNNWVTMDKSNDFSNNQPQPLAQPWPFSVLFKENRNVAVYGKLYDQQILIYGNTPRIHNNVLGNAHYIAEFTEAEEPSVDCVNFKNNLWSWNGYNYSGPEYVKCNGQACTCKTVAFCNAFGPNHSAYGYDGIAPAWELTAGPLSCN
jgi:hypothetical protein